MTQHSHAGNGQAPNGRQYFRGAADLVDSMVELGKAATRFSFAQMETAIYMLNEPARAIHRIRHSIDCFAYAMNQPAEEGSESAGAWFAEPHRPEAETFTGRKV